MRSFSRMNMAALAVTAVGWPGVEIEQRAEAPASQVWPLEPIGANKPNTLSQKKRRQRAKWSK